MFDVENMPGILKVRREALGLSAQDVARMVGISSAAYFDLEAVAADLRQAVGLDKIILLSKVLKEEAIARFRDSENADGKKVFLNDLPGLILTHVNGEGVSFADFSMCVGYEFSPDGLTNEDVLNWNLDCLFLVCAKLGVCEISLG